jgi:hypothetical protein
MRNLNTILTVTQPIPRPERSTPPIQRRIRLLIKPATMRATQTKISFHCSHRFSQTRLAQQFLFAFPATFKKPRRVLKPTLVTNQQHTFKRTGNDKRPVSLQATAKQGSKNGARLTSLDNHISTRHVASTQKEHKYVSSSRLCHSAFSFKVCPHTAHAFITTDPTPSQ